MKIIICNDSFKGSLTATEVAECIAQTIKEVNPAIHVLTIPLADGGEGTEEILQHSQINKKSQFTVSKLFLESAKVIGLPLYKPKERNPLKLSSLPLGLDIKNKLNSKVKEITVSLGGSATCDGGMGMLYGLGYRFLDENGVELLPSGENLSKIFKILDSPLASTLRKIKFKAVCDVENPLTGENGAAYVFAPQKGAKPEDLPILDHGLKHFAEISAKYGFGSIETIYQVGTGAAGGLGFAFTAFLNAKIIKGIDYILDTLDFDNIIKDADLIITGEGKVDRQSLMGKVVSGVLKRSQKQNIPVMVVAGKAEDKEILFSAGISQLIEISDLTLSHSQNMHPTQALHNLRSCILKHFS